MNILFNAACIKSPLTGIGHFAYQSLKEMQKIQNHEIVTYHFEEPHNTPSNRQAPLSKIKLLIGKLPFVFSILKFKRALKFNQFVREHSCDVYLEPNFINYDTSIPYVTCIYDLSFIRHPETHPKSRLNLFKKKMNSAIDNAKAIITISEFSKSELIDVYKVPEAKIHVAYCGASEEFKPRSVEETEATLKKYHLNYKKFLIIIGTFEPRKNIVRACEAYAQLPESLRKKYPLVLCGAYGWGDIQLSDKVKELIQSQEIRILKYVSNEDLQHLTSAARL